MRATRDFELLRARRASEIGIALGRGVKYYDMPRVRAIVRDAASQDYRLSAIVLGIIRSNQFQMRVKAQEAKLAQR
jgi:hypothetical protein